MNSRLDAMSPRPKKDGGTFWVRVGTAWVSEKGTQIVLDALPIPDSEGRVVINLFEPRDRDQAPRQQQSQQRGGYAPAGFDDEVPGF
jgi:hypothetical protein